MSEATLTEQERETYCNLYKEYAKKYAQQYPNELAIDIYNNYAAGSLPVPHMLDTDGTDKLRECFIKELNTALKDVQNQNITESKSGPVQTNNMLTIGVGIGGLLLGGIIGYVMRGSDKSSASS